MMAAPDSIAEPADGLPVPQRYRSMATILLGISIAVLDASIVNLALPGIVRDLHASAASAVWVITAYQVATLVLLLPCAMLGDLIGHRRVYLAGLALFTIASIGCAFSTSLLMLVAARTLQGLGAGGLLSVNASLVRRTYPRASSAAASRSIRSSSPPLPSPGRRSRRWCSRSPRGRGSSPSICRSASSCWRSAGGRCRATRASHARARACRPSTCCSMCSCSASFFSAPTRWARTSLARRHGSRPRGERLAGGRRRRDRRDLRAAAAALDAPAVSARPAAHPDLRAVDVHVGRGLRRPDAGLRGAALSHARGLGPLARHDRPPDLGLADRHRHDGADRRSPHRPHRRWPARCRRPDDHGRRPGRARLAAGPPRQCGRGLAHGAVRLGLRPLPVAQQPHHRDLAAAASQRRGQRHAGHRAAHRPDLWLSVVGAHLRRVRRAQRAWPEHRAGHRRSVRRCRRRLFSGMRRCVPFLAH